MDRLWTPWRYAYVTNEKPRGRKGVPADLEAWPGPDTGCVFCNLLHSVDWAISEGMSEEVADEKGFIVSRGQFGYICLNAFPYASGHVLLVPYRHLSSLAALPIEEAEELIREAQRVETAFTEIYSPDGVNLGMNLGKAAGAGVAEHLHVHVLPRWVGDTNFMTVIAETRIMPETLDVTWRRLREKLSPKAHKKETIDSGAASE